MTRAASLERNPETREQRYTHFANFGAPWTISDSPLRRSQFDAVDGIPSASLCRIKYTPTLATGNKLADFDPHAVLRDEPGITGEAKPVLDLR